MSVEDKPLLVIKPNILMNSVITFFKLSIPAFLMILGLYYLKTLELIKTTSVLNFYIVAVVFVFTFLILFLILFEQNKKLKFYEGGVGYSDLFDLKEFPKRDIKDITYKKGIINSFILEKKATEKKIVIPFVNIEKNFESIKNKILKKEKEKITKKVKKSKFSVHQLRRKRRIDDIVSGKRRVIFKNPNKKKKDYLEMSEKKSDFINVKNLKMRTDKDFIEVGKKKGKKKNVFKDLKNMKEKPKSLFKKVKELKK